MTHKRAWKATGVLALLLGGGAAWGEPPVGEGPIPRECPPAAAHAPRPTCKKNCCDLFAHWLSGFFRGAGQEHCSMNGSCPASPPCCPVGCALTGCGGLCGSVALNMDAGAPVAACPGVAPATCPCPVSNNVYRPAVRDATTPTGPAPPVMCAPPPVAPNPASGTAISVESVYGPSTYYVPFPPAPTMAPPMSAMPVPPLMALPPPPYMPPMAQWLAVRRKQQQGKDLMMLYQICCKNGLYKEAERIALAACELDPDNVAAEAAVLVARRLHGKAKHHPVKQPREPRSTRQSCVPATPETIGKKELVSGLMKRFHTLYKEAQYQEAEQVARQALELVPGNEAISAALHLAHIRQNVPAPRDNQLQQRPAVPQGACMPQVPFAIWERQSQVFESIPQAIEVAPCPAPTSSCGHGNVHPGCCIQGGDRARCVKQGAIEKRLAEPVSLNFKDARLEQIIAMLRDATGLNISADSAALNEAGIDLQRPMSLHVENVSLQATLNLLLRPFHLTCVVRDEVLVITTEAGARGKLMGRVHPIADMMFWDAGETAGCSPLCFLGATDCATTLIQAISSAVAPQTRCPRGGPGTIDSFPLGQSLMIYQTADVQEQVADMLATLRRLHDDRQTQEKHLPENR